jgi:hypothetical protein
MLVLFEKIIYIGFEVLTAVVMKFAIFWDIAPCSSYMSRRFGETDKLQLQGRNNLFL